MDNRASAVTAEIPRDPFYMTAGRRLARRLTEISSIRNGLRIVARAGALPAAVWQRLPVDGVFDVTLSERASIQYRAIPQDLIARALYWKGVEAWESATIRTFRKVVRTAESFLDIGANSGFYTLLAAAERPNIRCDAFEPVPRIYKRLCEHIELNGFANRCRAHNVALSDSVGTAQFHVPFEEFPSSSSLNVSGFRGIPGQLIDVPVMSCSECPKSSPNRGQS
jgi:FkbM family methyltransferase